jgi:hypothetical protein
LLAVAVLRDLLAVQLGDEMARDVGLLLAGIADQAAAAVLIEDLGSTAEQLHVRRLVELAVAADRRPPSTGLAWMYSMIARESGRVRGDAFVLAFEEEVIVECA